MLEIATVFDFTQDAVILVVGVTAVFASLGVVLCSAPIYSALYLISHMICLALLFLLFNAEFLAVVQIIVYAGAVMILFLFIIALLGGKKEIQENTFHRSMALAFVFTLLGELYLSATVGPTRQLLGEIPPEIFGTAKAIGIELFTKHLVAFELASGLLLVAAVGVICLAKFSFAPLRRRTR